PLRTPVFRGPSAHPASFRSGPSPAFLPNIVQAIVVRGLRTPSSSATGRLLPIRSLPPADPHANFRLPASAIAHCGPTPASSPLRRDSNSLPPRPGDRSPAPVPFSAPPILIPTQN